MLEDLSQPLAVNSLPLVLQDESRRMAPGEECEYHYYRQGHIIHQLRHHYHSKHQQYAGRSRIHLHVNKKHYLNKSDTHAKIW
jgi:hypothetical protein